MTVVLLLAMLQDERFEEKRLATIPANAFVRLVVFSPDGRHVAFVAREDRGTVWSAHVDGAKGAEYASIDRLAFAPDGRTPAYRVTDEGKFAVVVGAKRGELFDRLEPYFFAPEVAYAGRAGMTWRIVIGDRASPEFELVQFTGGKSFFPSPDGRRVACGGEWKGKSFLVLDTEKGEEFEQIRPPVFSADGSTLAYAAMLDGAWHIVSGGKRGEAYEQVGPPVLSADGRTVAYAARKDRRWTVVPGGGSYDRVMDVAIGADGKTVAFLAEQDRRCFAVVNGKPGEPFDDVAALALGGDTIAYVAEEKGKRFVVSGGKRGEAFDEIDAPVIEGKIVHYRARRGGKKHLVVGDHVSEACEEIEGPKFGRDGLWAYRGWRNRKWFVVISGKRGEEFDEVRDLVVDRVAAYPASAGGKFFVVAGETRGPDFAGVGTPVIAPDGTTVAYQAWMAERKACVVVGDAKGETFADVSTPVFSADSRTVAYGAFRDGKRYMVVGARAVGPFDEVWAPVFRGRQAGFGARSGSELWWRVAE